MVGWLMTSRGLFINPVYYMLGISGDDDLQGIMFLPNQNSMKQLGGFEHRTYLVLVPETFRYTYPQSTDSLSCFL